MSETAEIADITEWRWANESACVHSLDSARVVRVTGDDARAWLNGQTTNDVRDVGADAAVYALSLDSRGRIQADLWVVAEGDGMAFVAPADATDALLEAMDRYIIMDDVELAVDPSLTVITVQGPKAAHVLAAAEDTLRRYSTTRLGAGGFDLWVPNDSVGATLAALGDAASAAGGGVASPEGWTAAHIAAIVPRYGADFDAKVYPQEAGLKERAVSFDKGCYLGQEVVCMLENRGKLARRLVRLRGPEGAAAEAGAQVQSAEGSRVGEVTSVSAELPARALALVKSAHAAVGTALHLGGATWSVDAEVGQPGAATEA